MKHNGYKREYKIRMLDPNKRHIMVAIPYEVIERQATSHKMTVAEFVTQFVAVAEFDNFEGVHYKFKRAGGSKRRTI